MHTMKICLKFFKILNNLTDILYSVNQLLWLHVTFQKYIRHFFLKHQKKGYVYIETCVCVCLIDH